MDQQSDYQMEQTGQESSTSASASATSTTCPICFDEMSIDDVVRFPNCVHSACSGCHEKCTATSNKCPVCRTPIEDENEIFAKIFKDLNEKLAGISSDIQKLQGMNIKTRLNDDTFNSTEDLTSLRSKLKDILSIALETGLLRIVDPLPQMTGGRSVFPPLPPFPPFPPLGNFTGVSGVTPIIIGRSTRNIPITESRDRSPYDENGNSFLENLQNLLSRLGGVAD